MTTIIYRYEIDGVTRYIGSSFDYQYKARQQHHIKRLFQRRRISSDRVLFFVIEECEDTSRFSRESFYINFYADKGYNLWNITDPMKMFPMNTLRGGHISDNARKKISESKTGKPRPDVSVSKKGKPVLPIGTKRPDVSERNKILKKGNPSKLKGKARPDVSLRLKGKKRPEISKMQTGRKLGPHSEETRRKISAALTGRKNPEHSKRLKGRKNPAISAAMKGKPNPSLSERNRVIHEIQNKILSQGKPCTWKEACKIYREKKLIKI